MFFIMPTSSFDKFSLKSYKVEKDIKLSPDKVLSKCNLQPERTHTTSKEAENGLASFPSVATLYAMAQ